VTNSKIIFTKTEKESKKISNKLNSTTIQKPKKPDHHHNRAMSLENSADSQNKFCQEVARKLLNIKQQKSKALPTMNW
jgi:hypothetical protein